MDSGVLRRPVEFARYLSIRYTERLAESIIGQFKAAAIDFRGPRKSMGQAKWEAPQWVIWYNAERPTSAICHRPPQERKDTFLASRNALGKAAQVSSKDLSGKPASVQKAARSLPGSGC